MLGMNYCAIASGSNGNCYYVAKEDTAVLIDVGINNKHLHLRMNKLGIIPTQVKAIFITHEHTDHIRGLAVFAKKYNIPVYITQGSYVGSRLCLPDNQVNFIQPNERVRVGGMEIIGVPKYHDAREPCSFVVTDGKTNIAVLTDIGRGCDHVKHVIQHSDVLLLESNYDEDMLESGRYPFYLKNRIRSGWGHLSNRIALELFIENRTPRLKHLILGHLSGENNTVARVMETFTPYCEQTRLSVATREEATIVFDTKELAGQTQTLVSVRVEQRTTIICEK